MESYEIIEGLYRVPGGYGKSGEVFGGILIKDNPTIVIGASGGKIFLRNLREIVSSFQLEADFRLYLTSVTFEEIITLELIREEFPDATFYIHKDIAFKIKEPRKYYLEDRFGEYNAKNVESIKKKLPKKIENIVEISKMSSYKADQTKILVIPFSGPHEGHTYIYSTKHKLLCTGLVGGYSTTDKRLYYLDFTGSPVNYKDSFSFLKQAEANIIAPSFDEPQLVKGTTLSTIEVETAITRDKESVYDLCTLHPKTMDEMLDEFRRYHGFDVRTPPYDRIKLDAVIIEYNINALMKEGKVITKDGRYKRA